MNDTFHRGVSVSANVIRVVVAVLCTTTFSHANDLPQRSAPRQASAIPSALSPAPAIAHVGGSLGVASPQTGTTSQAFDRGDIELTFTRAGVPQLSSIPRFVRREHDRYFAFDQRGNRVYFTIDPGLQERAELILKTYRTDYGSLVAVVPETGKILSIASHSTKEPGMLVATRATFPAASLMKMITAAAAVEHVGMSGSDQIRFHGGNYTLERYNYLPDARKDRRVMTLADALGKSVNPVFARVALGRFSPGILKHYAEMFGFNRDLQHEIPVEQSSFSLGFDDYSFARTAAGFGTVYLSPMHSALIAAALANHGTLMRPYLIENVVDRQGREIYRARPTVLTQTVLPSTASEVMRMMEHTVTDGTARKAFGNIRFGSVVGKTGTLSGTNPKGMHFWFAGAAPSHQPEVAVSGLVVNAGYAAIHGSNAARHLMEFYFHRRFGLSIPELRHSVRPAKAKRKSLGSKKRRATAVKAKRQKAPAKVTAKKTVVKKKVTRPAAKKTSSVKKKTKR